MKAMLIWSDGTEINTTIFEDKDGISGVDRAKAQMHSAKSISTRTAQKRRRFCANTVKSARF